MFNPFVCSQLPEGFQYLADERMPITALTYTIVGIILMLAVAVFLTVMTIRKHKLVGLCTFAGISIFMLFNFFLVIIITMFIPSGNEAIFIIFASLVSALIPFMGRLIVIKAFSRQQNSFSSHISYGVGIMGMKALVTILNFLIPISNYIQLSRHEIGYFFPAGEEAEIAKARAESIAKILNIEYSEYILMAIMALGVMVYSIAVTVPIYAAYKNKASKAWYGFAFGMGVLVNVFECLYNRNVKGTHILAVVLMVVAAAVTLVVSYKLYKSIEIDTEEKPKNTASDISKNAHVKIPRFKDLDKL